MQLTCHLSSLINCLIIFFFMYSTPPLVILLNSMVRKGKTSPVFTRKYTGECWDKCLPVFFSRSRY